MVIGVDCAACGTIYDSIVVYDNGDGSCEVTAQIDNAYVARDCQHAKCDEPLFNRTCTSFALPVTVVFRIKDPEKNYSSNIQGCLDTLGIGRPRYFYQVSIQMDPLSEMPTQLQPTFFDSLIQVSLNI